MERAQNAAGLVVVVELIFPSQHKEKDPNKSRFFNVRTSEKEAELVQATLDRLLREKDANGKWEDLLKKVKMTYNVNELERPRANRETHVEFFEADNPSVEHFASPSFVKTLLTRELLREFGVKEARELSFSMDLVGEGRTEDGRYAKGKLELQSDRLEGHRLRNGGQDQGRPGQDRSVSSRIGRSRSGWKPSTASWQRRPACEPCTPSC